MNRESFESIVARAVADLPAEFRTRLENVDMVVEDWPSKEQLATAGARHRSELLGLYEGVPQTERGINYGLVLPDKITIFQKPIEAICRSVEEIEQEVKRVVRHEIAHHFGIGDERLRAIEADI